MEQFNKALSFILGLVVVAVFIVVASGKYNIKGINLAKSTKNTNITPTITPIITPKPTSKPWFSFLSKPTVTPTSKSTYKAQIRPTTSMTLNSLSNTKRSIQTPQPIDPNYHSYSGSTIPTSIPNTGVPIVLYPLFGSSLLTGIFLRKLKKE